MSESQSEAGRYFEALDYAFDQIPVSVSAATLPHARAVRLPWWRRVIRRLRRAP